MSRTRHFASELEKIAFKVKNVPPITISSAGVTARTGSSVPMPATLPKTPAIKPPAPIRMGASKAVPTAAGANLGSKINPVPKTTPAPGYGGSLVR